MRHSLPQETVDKTKNYPTQLYGYLAIRFGQINIIYPQKSPASLEIQGLQDFNNYSHSTKTNAFCLGIILCNVSRSFDYLIYPYYPAYTS